MAIYGQTLIKAIIRAAVFMPRSLTGFSKSLLCYTFLIHISFLYGKSNASADETIQKTGFQETWYPCDISLRFPGGRDGSEIDVGIVFKKPMMPEDTRPLYHRIYSELSKIFQTSFTKDLDLVFLQKASLPLQYNAIINGSVLYEDDPIERVDYEEAVARQYMDFKPILEYFDTISMERYA